MDCAESLTSSQERRRNGSSPEKMKLGVCIIVVSYSHERGRIGAEKVLTISVLFSHPGSAIPMDPLDLDLINDLLEGEAYLKEVNCLSSYGVL
jgi:hypothetical protein